MDFNSFFILIIFMLKIKRSIISNISILKFFIILNNIQLVFEVQYNFTIIFCFQIPKLNYFHNLWNFP